jgi:hypothetical protein
MRWIVIILLVVNGIYYLWQNYLVPPEIHMPVVQLERQVSAARINLLAEVEDKERLAHKKQPKPESESGHGQESEVCWMIGPVAEMVSAKQLVDRLSALDIVADVKELVVPGEPTFWVHIPPLPSRKLALQKLRELQRLKIDSFLVTEGENTNAISLGFFSARERANKVMLRRIEQGYNAVIDDVPRSRTELWLVAKDDEYQKIAKPVWEKINQGNVSQERRKNFCKTIASMEKLD